MKLRKLSILAGIFAAALLAFLAVAAHASPQVNYIDVTTTADEWNVVGSGAGCSLREAITAANEDEPFGGCPSGSNSVRDYIIVHQGTYKIQIDGTDGDLMDIGKGDFDVKHDVTIQGVGITNTIIDAQGKDRIFDLDLGSRVRIQSMTLKNGEAGSEVGGAIRARGYETNLLTLVVQNNHSGDAAIYNNTGDMSLLRVVVQNNNLGNDIGTGAGGIHSFGVLTMDESLIYNNEGSVGAGIYVENSTVITNSTISGNKAVYRGGGIEVYNNNFGILVDLSNVTITDNHVDNGGQFHGSGVAGISNTKNGLVHVRNSILAGNVDEGFANEDDNSRAHDCWGSFISEGYNIIGKNYNCTGFTNSVNGDKVGTVNSPVDAKLNALANNGGFSKTHAPKLGSPALDAGNPNGCKDRFGTLLTTDQRNYARPVNANIGVPGQRCDIGAHEFNSPGFPTNTPSPTPTKTSTPTITPSPTATTPSNACQNKPAAPQLSKPKANAQVNKPQVKLDWNDVTCATKYKVLVKQDAQNGPKAAKKTVTVSNYTTQALAKGHTYYWRVKACNAAGCAKSNWSSFTVKP